LRQDNAYLRLMAHGHRLGLISKAVYEKMNLKRIRITSALEGLKKSKVTPESVNEILGQVGTTPISQNEYLYNLLKRPELHLSDLVGLIKLEILDNWGDPPWEQVREQVDLEIKYEGFIRRQNEQAKRVRKLDSKAIPKSFDFLSIAALSTEAREKLNRIRPQTIGQASRISGVSPADISILLVHLGRPRVANVSRET
ncbi:tRNA uridine-5-carboxymethylaminomethyl(34) synthesis enzyme MnmG, partial [candidate division KSB1 bacterium]|nr:tRNA uridine-5-carboxymethylaminomethyl(34) synthesis enzyme MnmG [candidate division KSB1 bacterium]